MKKRMAILLVLILSGWSFGKRLKFEDFIRVSQIRDLQVSPDGEVLAFVVSTPSIKENRNLSFVYLMDLKTGNYWKAASSGKDFSPRFTPEGDLAFLSARDGRVKVYILPRRGGEARVLLDFPADISDFRFSPDGKYILFSADVPPSYKDFKDLGEKLTEKGKRKWFTTRKLFYRVWNQWREGLYSHVFLARRDGKVLKDLMQGLSRDCPPLDLGTSHDFVFGDGGVYLVMNPDPEPALSTNNDVFFYDLKTSSLRKITRGRGNDAGPVPTPHGLAWLKMRRPGYESDQTEIFIKTSRGERNLTASLDRHIVDFLWGDGRFYFTAYDQGYHPIYSVDLEGRVNKILDRVYAKNLTYSRGRLFFTDEAVNRAPEIYSLDLSSGKVRRLTSINAEVLQGVEMNPLETFWFRGSGGDRVQGFLVKPPSFSPDKKYPTIMLIHGGPQGMWGDDFHPRWNISMFASPGYVVVMVNFHGSKGYGIRFTDSINRDWGGKPYQDIILGMKYAIKNYSFIDPQRIGAAGASYGGYMIDWIEGHNPGLFKALVSHAGVYDLPSMYGATEELWFPRWEFGGVPWEVPEVYRKWSPSTYVKNFKTPCLVVAGEHDYRVPYTQSLQFFTALKEMGVDAKLLFFHDEYHFVVKPRNRKVWWQEVLSWFESHLRR